MTSQSHTPLTTPPSSDVQIDWDTINANWEKAKNQTPLEIVEKHRDFHRRNNSSPDVIIALNLLWSDMYFLHGGGWQKLSEKK